MKIRKARIEDLDAIVDIACRSRQSIYADFIEASVWEEKRAEYFPSVYTNYIQGTSNIEHAFFRLLEDEKGLIAGFAAAGYVGKDWRDKVPLHWIHEIFLDPGKTGGGCGQLLMKEMGKHFQGLGDGPIGLSVGQGNQNAIRFYQKLGGRIQTKLDDNKVHGVTVPSNIIVWDNNDDLLSKFDI